MNISNKDCAPYVTDRREFKGSHLFGEWDGVAEWVGNENMYAVYSYGYHFPIYIWVGGVWYENTDKYSMSTSKHQTQARPDADTVKMDTDGMMDILRSSVQELMNSSYDEWFTVYGKKPIETELIY
jgi:hypothetical protein